MNKLFIIGLPRTGTTSISVALLKHFKVAHTGYTKRAFELADVVSDCPCFSDYQQLDLVFPGSKFVYLQRSIDQWIPSIHMLLNKMLPTINNENVYVNPILKRSFIQTFNLNNIQSTLDDEHLTICYKRHEKGIKEYFNRRNDLLTIDINQPDCFPQLLTFLALPNLDNEAFPYVNSGKRVDYWKEIKHVNKVNSNIAGREGRKFFDY